MARNGFLAAVFIALTSLVGIACSHESTRRASYEGIWRTHCSEAHGITVRSAGGTSYTIAFFGPGGEMAPGPPIDFGTDARIRPVDQDDFELTTPIGSTLYHYCSAL